jgi:hypothetical protein
MFPSTSTRVTGLAEENTLLKNSLCFSNKNSWRFEALPEE